MIFHLWIILIKFFYGAIFLLYSCKAGLYLILFYICYISLSFLLNGRSHAFFHYFGANFFFSLIFLRSFLKLYSTFFTALFSLLAPNLVKILFTFSYLFILFCKKGAILNDPLVYAFFKTFIYCISFCK
jgi:hypothetical protein